MNPNRKGVGACCVNSVGEYERDTHQQPIKIKPCRQAISSPLEISLVWGDLLHSASFALKNQVSMKLVDLMSLTLCIDVYLPHARSDGRKT